jgi:hypothetical protein
MKKKLLFVLFTIGLIANMYGQTNVTNNNTITIQGNVYYFRPSTTPSSPPPTQSSDFLGSGHWYGEDAAKAWASIADWVVDHCLDATSAITGNSSERVYISAVHVFRRGDRDFDNYKGGPGTPNMGYYDRQVRIDYWIVRNGEQMANGSRKTRWFVF